MKKETQCVRGTYNPANGEANVMPIAMSTAFRYDSTENIADLFDLKVPGFFYTRLANPTIDSAEAKLAMLEGGVGAMMTSSGQSASYLSIMNIANSGDHIISAAQIYGGTYNLFNVTMKKQGIEFSFIDVNNLEMLEKAFRTNTKAVFAETLANPAMSVLDIENVAKIAHKHGVPLIVDSTFATPVLCRPFEYGADIVVHSTTKYLDGHAVSVGGAIVDSGNFDWTQNDKFLGLTTPDDSYHGIIYTQTFGKAAYIVKARTQMMRDLGCQLSPFNAFLTNLGMETLHLRMERHCQNALEVAEFLSKNKKIKSVNYPSLKENKYYDNCQKYLKGKGSGVIMFELGSREQCVKFMDNLKLILRLVHVADLRSCALHPASATHRQLSDEALMAAGISPCSIRLSVGIENAADIIEDIENALKNI